MTGVYWRRQFYPLTETSDMEQCTRCGVYVLVKDGKLEPHPPCEETPSEEA